MEHKILVRKRSRIFGGVCSGLASYFNVNKGLLRMITLCLLVLLELPMVLIYVLAWMLVVLQPLNEFEKRVFYRQTIKNQKLGVFKSKNGIALGVCKGLAYKFNLNRNGLRTLFVLSALCFGLGIFVYIVLALIFPSRSDYEIKLLNRANTLKSKNSQLV